MGLITGFEQKKGGISSGRLVGVGDDAVYVKTGFDHTRKEDIKETKDVRQYMEDGARLEFIGRRLIDKFMGEGHTPSSKLGAFPFSTEDLIDGGGTPLKDVRENTILKKAEKHIPNVVEEKSAEAPAKTGRKNRLNLSIAAPKPVLNSAQALSDLQGSHILHIMSGRVDGYQPLGEGAINKLQSSSDDKGLNDVIRILAISHFFGNNDALGAAGDNCGRDKDGKIVIIDTGQFFAEKVSKDIDRITLGVGDDERLIININDLSDEHKKIFIDTLKKILDTTPEEYKELLMINKKEGKSLQNLSEGKIEQLLKDFEERKIAVQGLIAKLEKDGKDVANISATGLYPVKGPANIALSPNTVGKMITGTTEITK